MTSATGFEPTQTIYSRLSTVYYTHSFSFFDVMLRYHPPISDVFFYDVLIRLSDRCSHGVSNCPIMDLYDGPGCGHFFYYYSRVLGLD